MNTVVVTTVDGFMSPRRCARASGARSRPPLHIGHQRRGLAGGRLVTRHRWLCRGARVYREDAEAVIIAIACRPTGGAVAPGSAMGRPCGHHGRGWRELRTWSGTGHLRPARHWRLSGRLAKLGDLRASVMMRPRAVRAAARQPCAGGADQVRAGLDPSNKARQPGW